MNVKKWLFFMFFAILIASVAGCGQDESTNGQSNVNEKEESGDAIIEEEMIHIVTTIAQIGEPLSVIGGDVVQVESLMGPSVDPHLYQPTQSDISTVDDADIIFYNGLNLEANMVDIFEQMAASKRVLAIGETLSEDVLLEEKEGVVDPHIWFDIHLWKDALDAAVEELKDYAPHHAETFEENKRSYFAQLNDLFEEANEKLSNIPEEQRILVTAHDAFGYFGELFSIEVVGLQGLSTEDEIGVSDINQTITMIKEHEVPAIFVESSIDDRSVQAVIEGATNEGIDVRLGGELFSDAMGEEGTEEGTYIGMYRHNVHTIYDALTKGLNE